MKSASLPPTAPTAPPTTPLHNKPLPSHQLYRKRNEQTNKYLRNETHVSSCSSINQTNSRTVNQAKRSKRAACADPATTLFETARFSIAMSAPSTTSSACTSCSKSASLPIFNTNNNNKPTVKKNKLHGRQVPGIGQKGGQDSLMLNGQLATSKQQGSWGQQSSTNNKQPKI